MSEQTAYEARWIWWLTQVVLLKDGKVDVAHARAAFDSTATDPYHAQITPKEYASERMTVASMPKRCPDCGWSLPRFGCPYQGCNGVSLHTRRRSRPDAA